MNSGKRRSNPSAGYCGISKITITLSSTFVAEMALRGIVLLLCLVSLLCPSNSALLEKKSMQVSQTRTSLPSMEAELLDSI
jgi:hypothetical protein